MEIVEANEYNYREILSELHNEHKNKLDEKEYEKVNNEYHAYDDLYNIEKVLKSTKLKVDKINEVQLQIDNLKEFECDFIDEDLEDQLTKIQDCVPWHTQLVHFKFTITVNDWIPISLT